MVIHLNMNFCFSGIRHDTEHYRSQPAYILSLYNARTHGSVDRVNYIVASVCGIQC